MRFSVPWVRALLLLGCCGLIQSTGVAQITEDFGGIQITPSSPSVYPGQSATVTLTLGNPRFTLPVTLSHSSLPANTTFVFSPASISGSGSSKLTIQTLAPHQVSALGRPWKGWGVIAVCGCFLFLVPRRYRRNGGLVALLLFAGLGVTAGCGSPVPVTGGTPPGMYDVTVTGTATSGSDTVSSTTEFSLTVKSY